MVEVLSIHVRTWNIETFGGYFKKGTGKEGEYMYIYVYIKMSQ
jgi:hypothetical protein